MATNPIRRYHLSKLPERQPRSDTFPESHRYGRTVAEILRKGQNINRRMVRVGQAFAYRRYLKNCDSATYLGAEKAAETARLGTWADWT
jgi:endonuclease YncB( thermonuclease family)